MIKVFTVYNFRKKNIRNALYNTVFTESIPLQGALLTRGSLAKVVM